MKTLVCMRRLFCLVLLAFSTSAFAQTVTVHGTIHERGSRETVPGASLHILGTSRGALSNSDGKYRLSLERGTFYSIRITAIGYRPDTVRFTAYSDSSFDISLAVSSIQARAVTVTASSTRDEARRIMHKVIETKDAWQSQIEDYRFDLYSRGDLRVQTDSVSGTSTASDSSHIKNNILAILESAGNGYWKRGSGYAERITARKETADVPAEVNRVALFDIENFYNDRMQIQDYTVVSPVAHDAFDRYDYDLLGEGELNGAKVYKIAVEPTSNLFPAFTGTLWIDETDYTIAYLELSPNDAIKVGPLKGIIFRQTFSFVENTFWMPSEMSFNCAIAFDLPVVPNFEISQTATLENYVINGGLDDSLFTNQRHVVAQSADSVDSLHWVAVRTIPLAHDEDTAYRVFDSLAVVFDSLESHGSGASFSPASLALGLISTHLYQFNRVEGSHFELGHSWTLSESHPFTLNVAGGYGVSDAKWKYSFGFTQALTMRPADAFSFNIPIGGDIHFTSIKARPEVATSMSANVYDEYVRLSNEYDPLVNTLTALFLHVDYPDYYHARGFNIDFDFTPSRHFSAAIEFKNEVDRSLSNVTDYSILLSKNTFRKNPTIDDGLLHELSASIGGDARPGFWNVDWNADFAYSNPSLGGRFHYATAALGVTLDGKLGGWGKAWLSTNYKMLLLGALPAQSLFFFEARDAVLAPRDVFRTLSPFEFEGDRAWTVMFEQNFYDLPTRALGLKIFQDLQWFGFANAAGATLSSATQTLLPVPRVTLGSVPYAEAGFGIGNILNVLRFDAAWRLTHRLQNNLFVTGTMAITF